MLFMPCRSSADSLSQTPNQTGGSVSEISCIFLVCNTATATAKKDRKIAMDVPMVLRRVYTIIYPIIIIILINNNIINSIAIHERLMIFASAWVFIYLFMSFCLWTLIVRQTRSEVRSSFQRNTPTTSTTSNSNSTKKIISFSPVRGCSP